MKKYSITILAVVLYGTAFACEVCKRQQPKVLRGITHGAGPQSDWDYVIVGVVSIIVLATLYYSVKWLLRPGEHDAAHIKHNILTFE